MSTLVTFMADRAAQHGLGAATCLAKLRDEIIDAGAGPDLIEQGDAAVWGQQLAALTHLLFHELQNLEATLADLPPDLEERS